MISNVDSTVNHATGEESKLRGGSMNEIDEINDEFSVELNSQSLATQTKRGEQIASMMPAIKTLLI